MTMYTCCNASCGWRGPLQETCMLGAVGPLCPLCREVVEPDDAPSPNAHGRLVKGAAALAELDAEAENIASAAYSSDYDAEPAIKALIRRALGVPAKDQ